MFEEQALLMMKELTQEKKPHDSPTKNTPDQSKKEKAKKGDWEITDDGEEDVDPERHQGHGVQEDNFGQYTNDKPKNRDFNGGNQQQRQQDLRQPRDRRERDPRQPRDRDPNQRRDPRQPRERD